MRQDARDQRLDDLEFDFRERLVACLRECANGRWGLFEQNSKGKLAQLPTWPEADELKATVAQINELRSRFGQTNPLSVRFLEYCAMRGQNVKGEPKLARQFLTEIGEV